MPDKRQWILLLLVFVLTGAGVAGVRWYTNQQTLAWVKVVPHDGQVISGGLAAVEHSMAADSLAGVFYQGQLESYMLPFQGSLEPELLHELQQSTAAVDWYDVNPDTLFLRSWSRSYARLLMALTEEVRDSINNTSEKYARLRTLAVVAKGQRRDSLLQELGANMDQLTRDKYTTMRKRFAQQLLNASNRQMAAQPGRHWVFLVDIELFPYVREAFVKANRYQFEE